MNSVHDMGGMHGLGPIPYAPAEPVFHAPWEGRVAALFAALGAFGRWNTDAVRYRMERMPPAEYLRASYYERWLAALAALSLEAGLVSQAELNSGRPDPGSATQAPALTPEQARANLGRNREWARPEPAPARFRPGDTVRARNIHPVSHTRLPRYVRGRTGTIERSRGARAFPADGALGSAETSQHLYLVRFGASELWGEAANPRDSVHLELYDSYLEPV
jgi:nitrile hydratase